MRYAKVSFKNLSGKTVVVTAETNIPMANKEVDLYPGSQAKLEIQSSIKEPVIFTAKEKELNREMYLNNEKSYKVQPTTDPTYNVTITVVDPGKKSFSSLVILINVTMPTVLGQYLNLKSYATL